MLRTLINRIRRTSEHGQALVLFGGGIIVFTGFVAMSIDVGRAYWAKTTIQAAVDAASLAGAQSMPAGTTTAGADATANFDLNAGFLYSQGQNVTRVISYPNGNRAVKIQADADIPTWFARVFGINQWHVSASATAESQVLDIAVVLDISGSMCLDSFPAVLTGDAANFNGVVMSPGRFTPPGGSYALPRLLVPITSVQTVIALNSVAIFNSTTSSYNNANFGFNTTTRYYQYDIGNPGGSGYYAGTSSTAIARRKGLIMIDNEVMRITALNSTAKTITVLRGQTTMQTDVAVATTAVAHAANTIVYANRTGTNYCDFASLYQATSSTNGPAQPFDGAISNAQYFVSLFSESYDKIGFATYSTSGTLRRSLSNSWSTVQADMDSVLFPAGGTNIAHGIGIGRQILDGTGKRSNSVRILVVLTDGVPNYYCSNASAYTTAASCSTVNSTTPASCPASSTAITHAVNQAAAAAASDITVYTIGLGSGVLSCVLDQISAAGNGETFLAPTLAQLDDAFDEIAAKTHIAIVE